MYLYALIIPNYAKITIENKNARDKFILNKI